MASTLFYAIQSIKVELMRTRENELTHEKQNESETLDFQELFPRL